MLLVRSFSFLSLLFILFCTTASQANGPDLTTNGDFENLLTHSGNDFCLTPHYRFDLGQIPIQGWNTGNIYSTQCTTTNQSNTLNPTYDWRSQRLKLKDLPEFGSPKNSFGAQSPRTLPNSQKNETYALLSDVFNDAFRTWHPDSRTGLINKLQSRLIAGAHYDVSFEASFPDLLQEATRLGLYFITNNEIQTLYPMAWTASLHAIVSHNLEYGSALPIRLGAISQTFITDRVGWTQISNDYVAEGTEENVFIGNLTDDPNDSTKRTRIPTDCSDPDYCVPNNFNYPTIAIHPSYYIDNVSVTCKDDAVDFKGTPSPVKINRCDTAQFDSYVLHAKGDQYGIDVLLRQNSSWKKVNQYLLNPSLKTSWSLTELGLDLKSVPAGGHYKFKSTYNTCMGNKIEPEKEITIEDVFMGTAKFSMNGNFSDVLRSNICHENVIVAPEISSEVSSVEFTIYHEKNPALKIVVPQVKQGDSFSIYSLPKPQGWIWDTDTYVIEMKFSVACPTTPIIITKKMVLSNAFSLNWMIERTRGLVGDFIQFGDSTPDVLKREWSITGPGMAILDSQKKLRPQFLDAGSYRMKFEIFGKESCHHVETKDIEIFEGVDKSLIFIPNAFTPRNDDGVNERFYPKGQYFFYELKVFNTYGEKIYESPEIEDPNDTTRDLGWDGYYQGKVAPQGAYFFQVRIFDQLRRPVAYPPGGVVQVL